MGEMLSQLGGLATAHNVPIICAGDIFDRWNAGPELINFAIRNLPKMHAIPGQHDLPLHNYDHIERSAYWTLVEAGVVYDMGTDPYVIGDQIVAHPFPWGHDVAPLEEGANHGWIDLAVVHAYCWKGTFKYHGASEDQAVKSWREKLEGYDAAVFGDNHKGFHSLSKTSGQHILNCGTFMVRKADEREYKPHVGLLHSDGFIRLEYLNTEDDYYLDEDVLKTVGSAGLDLTEFLTDVVETGGNFASSFQESLKRLRVTVDVDRVKNVLAEMMEFIAR